MTQFAGALGHMNTRSDRFRHLNCRNSCSLGRIQGWVGVGQLVLVEYYIHDVD